MSDDDRTEAVQEPLPLSGTPGADGEFRDWALAEVIGRGGSSVVYAATRTAKGFRQHAALKILETGASDERFVARFERERRILLQLVHPSIVRLLDGGTTDTGRPWYAMERIDGVPLTAWATDRPLPERIRALIAVCRAVAFAHQRLIVHCDLKPANVLVDSEGTPHVLDFGIARLLDEHENTGTLQLLTPRWAAPEQLEGRAVTTQTDVYALGLLSWAVLTGAAPRDGLTGAALVTTAQDVLAAPSTHATGCRGDLDAIVLRATAPEPEARYRTAAELADDLERHLRGDAVQAREGVLWYRTTRWIRRNRAIVAGLSVGALLLAGWAVTMTVQSNQIAAERDRARQQAVRAEQTLDLLVGMLEAADPAHARGEALTVKEVLRSGARELEVSDAEPELRGELRYALGRVLYASGAEEDAEASLVEAVDVLTSAYGPDHRQTLRASLLLTKVRSTQKNEPKAYLPEAEAILEQFEAGPRDAALARALLMVADLSATAGELERGREQTREARALFQELGDARSAARALAIDGYIGCRLDDDATLLRRALEETEAVLGTRVHPDVADLLQELSQCTSATAEDRAIAEEAMELRRTLVGESWVLATALNNYGLYLESRDPEAAIAKTREAWEMASSVRGADHPQAVRLGMNHAAVRIDTALSDASVQVGLDLLQQFAADERQDTYNRATSLRLLGQYHAARGDGATARTLYEQGLAMNPPGNVAARLRTALESL
jgi:serine/threonine-protein kinase